MRKDLCKLALLACTLFVLCASVARADDIGYGVTDTDQFGTIDLNTGVFTGIASQTVQFGGLGVYDGTLYGAGHDTGTLYTIDPTTGALTIVGSSPGVSYENFGSTLTGLYAMDTSGNLYSINPSTGAATLIGSTVSSFGLNTLSTNSSTLYLADGKNLYTINTTTGAATNIGGTPSNGMTAMLQEDGTLYGEALGSGTANMDTIDPSTGVATTGPSITGASGPLFGLAPDPLTVPEPATVGLTLVGLGLLMLIRMRIPLGHQQAS